MDDLTARVLYHKEMDLLTGVKNRMFHGGEGSSDPHTIEIPTSQVADAAMVEMQIAIAAILWLRSKYKEDE